MSKPEWSARLTATIAKEVREHRQARRMSVRELSEAVERCGLQMAPPVLSNLELGRRETISQAEVFALGAALGVPPLLLVFPVGRVNAVEVLPDHEMTPWTALRWALTGRPHVPGTAEVSKDDAELIDRFQVQQNLIEEWAQARAAARSLQDSAEIERAELQQRRAVDALRVVRGLLRQSGLMPLGLPAGLGYLDEEAAP